MTIRSTYVLMAAGIAALGCSKPDATPNADSPAAAASAPAVVTIVASDFAFAAPDSVAAGVVTLRLENKGPDLHHAHLVKLAEGKQIADVVAAFKTPGPPPTWIEDIGGPNAPAPGETSEVTMTLEPGNYALTCFIDTPDHVMHLMKGMVKAFTVTAAPAGAVAASEPTPDVTMTLSDYAFATSVPLTAGHHTIRLENTAAQAHEVFIAQLAPGKALADLMAWAQTYKGPPPAKPFGGITGFRPGTHRFITVDLPPGEYVLLCFVLDAKDGKAHVEHGMAQQVTLK